jgi:hypothetical protein
VVVFGMISRVRTMLLTTAVFAGLVIASPSVVDRIDTARDRVAFANQRIGFLEERGYDRIVNHPEYWLLGAGEGYYRRYAETSAIGAHELHSSVGTLLHCYGAIGLGLFVVFVFRVFRRMDRRAILVALAPAAYGLSHQGLRVTLLWVMLALVICLKDLEAKRRASALDHARAGHRTDRGKS